MGIGGEKKAGITIFKDHDPARVMKAEWLKLHLKSESLNAIIAIFKILSQII